MLRTPLDFPHKLLERSISVSSLKINLIVLLDRPSIEDGGSAPTGARAGMRAEGRAIRSRIREEKRPF